MWEHISMSATRKNKSYQSDLELTNQFIKGNQSVQNSLHAIVNDLLDKAFQALAAKGSRFRDPDNVRQEIIINVLLDNEYAVLRNFNGASRLTTYLWSVIRFKLIDALRQEIIAAGREDKMPEEIPQNPVNQSSELSDLVHNYLNKMTEKEVFILERRWLQQLSYDEICGEAAEKSIEIDKTYIGNLLFKARQEIIKYLKNHGYDFDKQIEKEI